MSYRLCAMCGSVNDNHIHNKEECFNCNGVCWADPTESHDEWGLIYGLQKQNAKLKAELVKERECLDGWLKWEDGQIEKEGPYAGEEINKLIDKGRQRQKERDQSILKDRDKDEN